MLPLQADRRDKQTLSHPMVRSSLWEWCATLVLKFRGGGLISIPSSHHLWERRGGTCGPTPPLPWARACWTGSSRYFPPTHNSKSLRIQRSIYCSAMRALCYRISARRVCVCVCLHLAKNVSHSNNDHKPATSGTHHMHPRMSSYVPVVHAQLHADSLRMTASELSPKLYHYKLGVVCTSHLVTMADHIVMVLMLLACRHLADETGQLQVSLKTVTVRSPRRRCHFRPPYLFCVYPS